MSAGELRRRAEENTQGGAAPAEWGPEATVEVGGFFEGRVRSASKEEGGRSGGWLFWDASGEPCFLWGCARLDAAFDRDKPNVGDEVAIFRDENYETKYDAPGEASGLAYGVAFRPCSDPLPTEGGDDDGDLY